MELTPGAIVGRLRLLECIAEGGTSAVWSAHHLTRGHDVAVKFISKANAEARPAFRLRLQREATIGRTIGSEHVVMVHEEGETDDGTPYIVMDLLEGIDLARAVMAAGPMTLHETAAVVAQVAEVLDRAHGLNIVHRDIKPDNIFLVEGTNLSVKVLDFGVAKLGVERGGRPTRSSRPSTMTRGGMIVGSPDFMSPEQSVSSHDVDFRTDLFSLGVVAYFALTADLPFSVGDKTARWRQIEAGPTPIRRWSSDLPEALDGWFRRALALLPEQRFSSARAMAEALCATVSPHVPETPPTTDRISQESGAFRRPHPMPAAHHGMQLASALPEAGTRRPAPAPAAAVERAPESGRITVPSHVVQGVEPPRASVAVSGLAEAPTLTTVNSVERLAMLPATPPRQVDASDVAPEVTPRVTPPRSLPGSGEPPKPSPSSPLGPSPRTAPRDEGVSPLLWSLLLVVTAITTALLVLR
ncbi:MAG: serine/threonine protein kinase [Deltaproteobacteria bacterium]|nr:serine/threonine protein kinase [Deltaproteobacteria bacterium]